jgi:hypothetical protein
VIGRFDRDRGNCAYFCDAPDGSGLAFVSPFNRGGFVSSRHYDDWTVESWRIEPRLRPVDADASDAELNPPLWKDLTLASVVALLLWGAAVAIFA